MKIEIPKSVEFIINNIETEGYEAYVVGGCVRDSLIGRIPNDWDITTNAKPSEIKDIFSKLDIKVIETGIKHGTVTLILEKIPYEITTYRIEGKYSDKRHPDMVEFTKNIKKDLNRRDFTINAMAYNYKNGLVDCYSGLCDLKNNIIKCVGDPSKRFREDALRMIRAIRFSAQLNFEIEIHTKEAIKDLSYNIKNVSMERIKEEFNKILLSDDVFKIHKLNKYGLMKYFLPEFDICENTKQNHPYHIFNVGSHILHAVSEISNELHLRLTMLLHDICKPNCKITDEKGIDHFYGHAEKSAEACKNILKRMKYDNQTIIKVYNLVKYHDYEVYSNRSIKRLLNKMGEENFRDLLKVKEADIKAQNPKYYNKNHNILLEIEKRLEHILENKECFSLKNLNISGKDLIELGFEQGKEMGYVLKKLLDIVIENPDLNVSEELKSMALKMIKDDK